ncbi:MULTISPECIES: GrpB family protein [Exiguobacterium]|uniref:Dephospho-CoA kinase/protein folding accessory domain-containing protein n=1 Tax=Exiguobacterium aurantiacum TaxID=33987 RepID=A0A377FQZ5_9BACL|nr:MULTISPECIES: GrpB family protein [Exiguobacterium]STO06886.1 dephospho-CoA kinase/protein folding accessory domain-containing protein [Exiguobacterium aurantiacum]
MRRVEVVPYDPTWVARFEEEAGRLSRLFEGTVLAIHHIGSTSVPGLEAKPIIDIMPVVRAIEQVDELSGHMEALGYRSFGEHGIPRRRFFAKGDDVRTFHVHVFEAGDDGVTRHLAFREYLKAFPDVRAEYGDLKRTLAEQHPTDIESYIQGKQEWVSETERVATIWYMAEQTK